MAADDRKRRILDHLAQSTNGMKYVSPQKKTTSDRLMPPSEAIISPSVPTPPQIKSRKRRIMDHLSQSSQEFGDFSSDSDSKNRKQQIQNHIRKSLS